MGNFVDEYFSLIALFILFRETVEASIIVAVLLQFLARSFPHLRKQVWWGVVVGIFASIVFGVIFSVLFYVAKENVFNGNDKAIFKGCIAWFAAILMTILAFAMLRYKGWEDKIQRKLRILAAKELEREQRGDIEEPTTFRGRFKQGARKGCSKVGECCATSGSCVHNSTVACWSGVVWCCKAVLQFMPCAAMRPSMGPKSTGGVSSELVGDHADVVTNTSHGVGIFFLIFTTVLREGIESVIFLAGVGNSSATSLIFPGLVGFLCGVATGMFLYFTGRQVKDIRYFVIVMSLILFFMAAGQVMLGVKFLTDGGMFGYASVWLNERPWYMQKQWDISSCCAINDNDSQKFWVIAQAVVGYQDKPTFLQVVIYFGYWAIVIVSAIYKAYNGSLFDADYKHKKEMAKLAKQGQLDDQMDDQTVKQLELCDVDEAVVLAKKVPDSSTDLDSHTTGSDSPSRNKTSTEISSEGSLLPSAPPASADLHMQPPVQQSTQH